MHSLSQLFDWKLPGWFLTFWGLMEVLHMTKFVTNNLHFLATPVGNLFVIVFGLLWLFIANAVQNWKHKQRAQTSQTISPSDLLTVAAKDAARIRIDELSKRGEFLNGKVPRVGQSGEDFFCNFWAEEVAQWGRTIEIILRENCGKATAEDFTSSAGFNPAEAIGNVHKNVADAYRLLLHRQRKLSAIIRSI